MDSGDRASSVRVPMRGGNSRRYRSGDARSGWRRRNTPALDLERSRAPAAERREHGLHLSRRRISRHGPSRRIAQLSRIPEASRRRHQGSHAPERNLAALAIADSENYFAHQSENRAIARIASRIITSPAARRVWAFVISRRARQHRVRSRSSARRTPRASC